MITLFGWANIAKQTNKIVIPAVQRMANNVCKVRICACALIFN